MTIMNFEDLSFRVLDKGFVQYITHLGSDEQIIEAARMSTGKGFLGWYWEEDTYADCICMECKTQHLYDDLPLYDDLNLEGNDEVVCTNCWSVLISRFEDGLESLRDTPRKLLGKKGQKKDLSLLETLISNRHASPLEMGDLVIEVKAPIFVIREWHRHRTQSYNEMSGRYAKIPNEHYVPPFQRIQRQSSTNKQGSEGHFDAQEAYDIKIKFRQEQKLIYSNYEDMLKAGVAKEIARINTPVSRYTKMRAKANLRNWLAFLSLRLDLSAQWEIRQFAITIAYIVKQIWPHTFDLWMEHEFFGTSFSQKEMEVLVNSVTLLQESPAGIPWPEGFTEKQKASFLKKIKNKQDGYKDLIFFLENGRMENPTK